MYPVNRKAERKTVQLFCCSNLDLSVGDFASAEATDAAVGSRDLLKKVDQNLKKGNGYVVHLLFDVELVIISRRKSYIRHPTSHPERSNAESRDLRAISTDKR